MCPYGKRHRQLWPHLHWRGGALPSTEMQLSLLRNGRATMITEFNPNYEFGQNILGPLAQCYEQIKQIPREKVLLQQRLGRGAFGEVYAGRLFDDEDQCCVHLDPGAGLPVAVKTLPEFPTYDTAEIDFLTEALMMCKFDHHNVVKLIGVSFDRPPRFIILEL